MTVTAARSAEEKPSTAAGVRTGVITTAAVVAAVAWAIQLARLAVDAHGNPFDVVFSEDGQQFLPDAQRLGLRSLGYSFAGYGHLLPRVLALLGSHLPLGSYAVFCALASTAVVAAFAGFTFIAAQSVIGVRRAVLVALSLVLVPAIAWESLGVVANLQWFAIPTAAWCLVARDRPWLSRAVVLTAALTTPLIVLAAPVLLVQRRWWRHPSVPALVAGLLGQLVFISVAPSSGAGPDRQFGIGSHAVVQTLIYSTTPEAIGTRSMSTPAIWLTLLFMPALVALVVVRRSRLGILLALSGVGSLVVPSVITGDPTGRYVGLATTFLAMAAVQGSAPAWTLRRVSRAVHTLAALTVAVAVVVGFAASANRVDGESWSAQVRATSATCRQTGTAFFEVAPHRYFSPFRLRC